jgi:diguanylate cyclase (GGDEF)-like protein
MASRLADAPQPSAAILDVLVVEDEEVQCTALVAVVKTFGYQVRSARNGREALASYKRQPAAIVLTDWSMPEMTGLELCVALKELPSPPHVVVMSAHEGRARLLHALRAGADEFIAKPIDLDELEVRLLASARMVKATLALERQSEDRLIVARTDPLTTIANRRRMDEDLARAVDEAARYGRRYCLALCDVDHFKRYNDQHGHLLGDTALQRIAVVLRDSVRASDTVYRYGGEEFLVLFPQQSPAEVAEAMERVRAAVEALGIENAEPGSPHAVLTISTGIAELAGRDAATSLGRADAALYRSKADGRNRITLAN